MLYEPLVAEPQLAVPQPLLWHCRESFRAGKGRGNATFSVLTPSACGTHQLSASLECWRLIFAALSDSNRLAMATKYPKSAADRREWRGLRSKGCNRCWGNLPRLRNGGYSIVPLFSVAQRESCTIFSTEVNKPWKAIFESKAARRDWPMSIGQCRTR
jgi:hypothetical protein